MELDIKTAWWIWLAVSRFFLLFVAGVKSKTKKRIKLDSLFFLFIFLEVVASFTLLLSPFFLGTKIGEKSSNLNHSYTLPEESDKRGALSEVN